MPTSWVMRFLRAACYKADPRSYQYNSQPSTGSDLFLQVVLGNEGEKNVSQ